MKGGEINGDWIPMSSWLIIEEFRQVDVTDGQQP